MGEKGWPVENYVDIPGMFAGKLARSVEKPVPKTK